MISSKTSQLTLTSKLLNSLKSSYDIQFRINDQYMTKDTGLGFIRDFDEVYVIRFWKWVSLFQRSRLAVAR